MIKTQKRQKTKQLIIDCKDNNEYEALKCALNDPTARTSMVMIGSLLPLDQKTRQRIMTYIADKFTDEYTF